MASCGSCDVLNIYIYIYIRVCVCVCVRALIGSVKSGVTKNLFDAPLKSMSGFQIKIMYQPF